MTSLKRKVFKASIPSCTIISALYTRCIEKITNRRITNLLKERDICLMRSIKFNNQAPITTPINHTENGPYVIIANKYVMISKREYLEFLSIRNKNKKGNKEKLRLCGVKEY